MDAPALRTQDNAISFDASDVLCYVGGIVLARLVELQTGLKPRGVRNLGKELPYVIGDFYQTIPSKHDAYEIAQCCNTRLIRIVSFDMR